MDGQTKNLRLITLIDGQCCFVEIEEVGFDKGKLLFDSRSFRVLFLDSDWVKIPTLLLTSCVTLGKLFNLPNCLSLNRKMEIIAVI